MVCAISTGCASRFSGIALISASRSLPSGIVPLNSGVSVGPGATQLQVMPARAVSRASDLVNAMTAPLVPA